MSDKIYKTATGKNLDMEALRLKNEEVRAVGNMNVNARGDVLDAGNKPTSSRQSQVNKSYRKQIGNVAQDIPVVSSKEAATEMIEQYTDSVLKSELTLEEMLPGLDDVEVQAEEETKEEPTSGLAAAMAKAKDKK